MVSKNECAKSHFLSDLLQKTWPIIMGLEILLKLQLMDGSTAQDTEKTCYQAAIYVESQSIATMDATISPSCLP